MGYFLLISMVIFGIVIYCSERENQWLLNRIGDLQDENDQLRGELDSLKSQLPIPMPCCEKTDPRLKDWNESL